MTLTTKHIVFLILGLSVVWFLYLEREILAPFVLAVIFAYVFNPVVSLLQHWLKVPRILSVILIYALLISIIFTSLTYIGGQLISEANQLSTTENRLNILDQEQIANLPEWQIGARSIGFKTFAHELVRTLSNTAKNVQDNLWPYFTLAANQAIHVIVFLISSFYFLREGEKVVHPLKSWLSTKYHGELDDLVSRINKVLGDYLRGQLILVAIMSSVSWLTLTILGVKFALILGIITGFLELIPYFGPLVAITLTSTSAFITGSNNFGLDPFSLAILVGVLFFIFRQLEDYFIIPEILGRATKLHPLVVLFSVLAGGNLAGPLGFIVAVPIVSSLRILIPYLLRKAS